MKTLIAVLALCTLSGCAVGVKTLAWVYDGADPCQRQNNGGNYPSFCGAGGGQVYIYNNQDRVVGYTKR
jgi:hypothetical protein